MGFQYSSHFLVRMNERGVSENELHELLYGEIDKLIVPSRKDKTVELLLGYVNGKGLALIYNKVEKILITVRRMHKSEENLFKEIYYESKT